MLTYHNNIKTNLKTIIYFTDLFRNVNANNLSSVTL